MTNRSWRSFGAVWVVMAALLFGGVRHAAAVSAGITGLTTNPTGCNGCHNDMAASTPTVTLTGPTSVIPGAMNEYTLRIFDIAGQHGGGLDAGASQGTLSVGGSNSAGTQAANGEITHTAAKASDGTKTTFSFKWTAPSSFSSATLRAWGNAVNQNAQPTGDRAAFTSLTVFSSQSGGACATGGECLTTFCVDGVCCDSASCPAGQVCNLAGMQGHCATPPPPMHDSVVLAVPPINLNITGPTPVTKKVHVTVRNADPATEVLGHKIILSASATCPGVTVGTPDFDPTPASETNFVILAGGKMKMATVLVTVDPALIQTFNKKSPNRCTLTFTASTDVVGNVDPTPSNNSVTAELNITDKTDPPGTAVHETVIKSVAPVMLNIPKNMTTATKKVKITVVNADLQSPAEMPAVHPIQVTVSNDSCTIVGTPDFDPSPASSDTALVGGGASKMATVVITASRDNFLTTNSKSPMRCTVDFTRGAGSAGGDSEASNNATTLTIDVIDKNDF